MAFLFMFLWMECKQNGIKDTLAKWFYELKKSHEFRITFIFVFYVSAVLFRTILGRPIWLNPLSNILGIWGLYDAEGNLYTQNIENVVLFVPLLYLWLLINKKKNEGKRASSVFVYGVCTACCITLSIEFLQVFLRVGTIQITDIVFNIIGGVIGTILFLLVGKRRRKENAVNG